MGRIYLKVWAALAVAVLVSLCGGALTARWIGPPHEDLVPAIRAYAVGLARELPEDPDARRELLRQRAREHGVLLTLYAADRRTPLASTGAPLPPPVLGRDHWVRGLGGAGMAVALEDGRWLVIGQRRPPALRLLAHLAPVLAVVFALLALAAWPIARITTRRLEALHTAVRELGAGDLSARVPVRGRDEVADLARSFNQSAARIEALVAGQRRVLASASHELRTPLTRIRMAAELARTASPDRRDELLDGIEADIVELDALVEDLLLSGRLEAGAAPPPTDEVDLGRLVRHEAERCGAAVRGQGVAVGEPRMLRRLVRNLLDNARRHGAEPIEVEVGDGRITVLDAGPGIAPSERERVFEPFYRPPGQPEGDGGVGLGLALVRRIAAHHGATVSVGTRPDGRGTAITVRWAPRDPA